VFELQQFTPLLNTSVIIQSVKGIQHILLSYQHSGVAPPQEIMHNLSQPGDDSWLGEGAGCAR